MIHDARCNCGRLLLRWHKGSNGILDIKCGRCKAVAIVKLGSTALMSTG